MVFSSLVFLVLFLPIFLISYYVIPGRFVKAKNAVLLLFSLLFYASGEPIWVVVLVFSGLWDYTIGLFITRFRGRWQSKALLCLSMCGNLGLLLLLKYGAFFLSLIGVTATFAPTLPIGISFYTFQTLSYTLDLYRGEVKPQRNPITFLSFVAMFPQLVAGPIVRYADVEEGLAQRRVTAKSFSYGVTRFAAGLGKKVILANHAGKIAAELLGADVAFASTGGVWLGTLMFMFQIYFDFSGYSDMAIGLGKMIGFDFKENFDHPYTAKSITDFWRKWHISLGSFFRDYIYIPLGGNRRRAVLNILLTWFLTGLWHGASVNFILWGMYFGVILLLEKYVLRGLLQRVPAFIAHLYSLIAILFGWLIFYFTDLGRLAAFAARFWGAGGPFTDPRTTELLLGNLWMLPVLALFSTRIPARVAGRLKGAAPYSEHVINFALLCFCFVLLIGQSFNPFIYFRF
ncbi:MAG: MBOAT family protein [Oscillospiraceae bacterium]|nr:MBOAT family protein [Oscillospiraceae bacterium]